jgi:hypothetical protein
VQTKEAESLIEQSLAHPAHEPTPEAKPGTEERANRWRAIRKQGILGPPGPRIGKFLYPNLREFHTSSHSAECER